MSSSRGRVHGSREVTAAHSSRKLGQGALFTNENISIKVKIVLIFKNMKKIVLLSIEVIGSKIDNQFLRFWLC